MSAWFQKKTKNNLTLAERQHSYLGKNAAADVQYSVGDSKASVAETLGMAENRRIFCLLPGHSVSSVSI